MKQKRMQRKRKQEEDKGKLKQRILNKQPHRKS